MKPHNRMDSRSSKRGDAGATNDIGYENQTLVGRERNKLKVRKGD